MKNYKFILSLIFSLLLSVSILPNAFGAEEAGVCGMCGTSLQEGSVIFEITYDDGKVEKLGCPGCGISKMSGKGIKSAATMDFLSREMIDAKKAYYLKGTGVGFCCKPNWLSFKSKSDAEKFSKGFGGQVLNYDQAINQQHGMHD